MHKLIWALLVMVLISTIGRAASDDDSMAKLLVGEWQGSRHAVQYMKDGTWRLDPSEGTTHGNWRIVKGKLIETWRFQGESKDSSVSYEILVLDQKTLKTRDQKGVVFTSIRKNLPRR